MPQQPQRSILITGTSSGIGRQAALTLKERNWQVFATARNPSHVQELSNLDLTGIQMDLTNPTSIHQAVKTVLAITGNKLDALFNNAGILIAGGIDDLTPEMIKLQFETNVFGPIELIRQILPIMRQQGHGRIIQNSSILGVITMPYYGAYNASKFALEAFSLTLRQECKNTGIKVSIINPGPIQSELRSHAHEHYQKTIAALDDTPHKTAYSQLEQKYFSSSGSSGKLRQPPEAVMKQLIHALESNHPNIHYFVGWPAKCLALLNKILPERMMSWLLSKI